MIGHIFKYCISFPHEPGKIIEIQMPSRLTICDINHQDDCIFLWAMVDKNAPLKTERFVVQGTGWKIDNIEILYFLKTVHMPNGLVWHIFRVRDE